jgi:hypothetical protein
MCGDERYGGGYSGYVWARWVIAVVIGVLLVPTVYAASKNESSAVLMTPSYGCLTVQGNDDVLLAKYGRDAECAFDGATVWVDETVEEMRVFYQEEDGDLMCMTDPCAAEKRSTCPAAINNKVTFELCHSSRVEQLWTRKAGYNKFVSVAADRHPADSQCCLTAATKAYGGEVINNGYLWMEHCGVAQTDSASTARHGLEQNWKFFDEEPTYRVPAAELEHAAPAAAPILPVSAGNSVYASASMATKSTVKIGAVTGKMLG